MECPPAPPNDEPCFVDPTYSVDLATTPTDVCNFIEATTLGATNTLGGLEGPTLIPNCFSGVNVVSNTTASGYLGGDVWFRATVPASGRIAIETEELGICAGAFALYRNTAACPGPGTWNHLYPYNVTPALNFAPYGCSLVGPSGSDSPAAGHYSGLTPGETIYIRYWERANNEPGTFRLCIYEPELAPGDEPCGAQVLVAGIDNCSFQGGSTERTSPLPNTSAPVPTTVACGATIFPAMFEMWYRIPVTPEMTTFGLTMDTQAGSLNDVAMAWYRSTGACPGTLALTLLTCNNDQSATNLMPRINQVLPAGMVGEDLYVRVWSRQYGNFSICASENRPPPNDDPCGAIDLPTTFGGCNPIPTTNAVASPTGTTFPGGTVPNPTCGTPVAADVWYRVQVPPNGQVRIQTVADELTATGMQLYRFGATACPSLTLTPLPAPYQVPSCNATGMASLSVDLPALYYNEWLYLRVWRRGAIPDGSFGLCSFRTDAPDASCPDVSADSGGPNGNYSNNENFSQTFCPSSPTDVVHLSFSKFNTELNVDVLEVRDGDQVSSPCLGRFSGTTLPPQFVSSTPGGCLTIRFTSNATGTRPGWVAAVNCVPAPPENQCSAVITDSGGRCGNYGNNQSAPGSMQVFCATTIGEVPIINFTEFNLAANDFVTLYDGNNQFAPCLGTFSGNNLPPTISGTQPFTGAAGTGCLTLVLTSNGFGTAAGFVANRRFGPPPVLPTVINAPATPPAVVTSVTDCDARFYDSGGACGQYSNNEDFVITFCPTGVDPVELTFLSFDTEGNGWDQVFLYNSNIADNAAKVSSPNGFGNGPASAFGPGGWWGNVAPPTTVSTHPSGCLTLRFRSDASVVRTGWAVKVSCGVTPPPPPPPPPVGICGTSVFDMGGSAGNYSSSVGNLLPVWTETYCPDSSLPAGSTVSVEFLSFNTEANWDPLYIYNSDVVDPGALFDSGNPPPNTGFGSTGGPGGWWGTQPPGPFTSTHPSGCITFEFRSDNLVTLPGWEVLVTCNEPPGDPPDPPACVYLLRLYDACGDGWGGSSLDVVVNGVGPTRYTLGTGGFAQYEIPVPTNPAVVGFTYNGTGPNSNDNSYTFVRQGSAFADYISGSPIQPFWGVTVNCDIPNAPPEDCVGAVTLCNNLPFTSQTNHTGNFADLNSDNRGCLSGNERQGRWYVFSVQTPGSIGFTLKPQSPTDDYNFAVYGPFPAGTNTNTICPLVDTDPIRCSYASYATTLAANTASPLGAVNWTGMGRAEFGPQFEAPTPEINQPIGGNGWVPGITTTIPGQVFIMYLSNASGSGQGTLLEWNFAGGADLDCTVLPVELLSFDAEAKPAHVDVLWSTATERNSAWFDVQRSADGERFIDLGRVGAAGESQGPLDYVFKDMAPLEGISYYRLQQVDRDGQSTLSQVVPVQYRRDPRALELYPNPADANIRVQFDMADDGLVRWRISDASGRVALTGTTGSNKGRNGFDIDLQVLDAGTYTLQLMDQHGGPVGTARFVKR